MEVKMVAAGVVYALIVIQWYYFIYKKLIGIYERDVIKGIFT